MLGCIVFKLNQTESHSGLTDYKYEVMVDKKIQGKGLGTALENKLEEISRDEGVGRLTATVHKKNKLSVHFHRMRGWTVAAHSSRLTGTIIFTKVSKRIGSIGLDTSCASVEGDVKPHGKTNEPAPKVYAVLSPPLLSALLCSSLILLRHISSFFPLSDSERLTPPPRSSPWPALPHNRPRPHPRTKGVRARHKEGAHNKGVAIRFAHQQLYLQVGDLLRSSLTGMPLAFAPIHSPY